ncbi:unnamed protein product [Ilex paraguariensis]|uniref:Uncharacterized protein n=1 Tax=Ilex paraguariensis TaxID=185542 RepID=A0ABC8SUW0_9AQUA
MLLTRPSLSLSSSLPLQGDHAEDLEDSPPNSPNHSTLKVWTIYFSFSLRLSLSLSLLSPPTQTFLCLLHRHPLLQLGITPPNPPNTNQLVSLFFRQANSQHLLYPSLSLSLSFSLSIALLLTLANTPPLHLPPRNALSNSLLHRFLFVLFFNCHI